MSADTGALGAEAQRLAKALADWAESRSAGPAQNHVGDWGSHEHQAAAPTSCAVCPLCQLIALVRGERPEVLGKLVEAGTIALSALAGLVESHAPATTESSTKSSPSPAPTATASEPPIRVQRIDVS